MVKPVRGVAAPAVAERVRVVLLRVARPRVSRVVDGARVYGRDAENRLLTAVAVRATAAQTRRRTRFDHSCARPNEPRRQTAERPLNKARDNRHRVGRRVTTVSPD